MKKTDIEPDVCIKFKDNKIVSNKLIQFIIDFLVENPEFVGGYIDRDSCGRGNEDVKSNS